MKRPIAGPDRSMRFSRKAAAVALLAGIFSLAPLATSRTAAVADSGDEPVVKSHATANPVERMTVIGRVLDPSGKPVSSADVMVIVQAKQPARPMFTRETRPMTDHHGRSDDSGRFRIELPRTTSARDDCAGRHRAAPGYGMAWADLDPDAHAPAADIALQPELVIRGQLFDVQGQPARGVAIRIATLLHAMRGQVLAVIGQLFEKDALGTTSRAGPARRRATSRGDSRCTG